MRRIVFSSPFVPPEWVAAHDLAPCRRMLRGAGRAVLTEGMCPYAGAFLAEAPATPDLAGIVCTTVCDQMRRGSEELERDAAVPVFLMHVPATWQTETARGIYLAELERLGSFLSGLGGSRCSDRSLIAALEDRQARRERLLETRSRLSAREFAEATAHFHETGEVPNAAPLRRRDPPGVPLALLGGPLFRSHLSLFDAVEAAGGNVVLDGTETGERCFPAPPDRRAAASQPVAELVRMYFGTIPDPFRRPNDRFYEWVARETRLRGVRGILLVRHPWCDTWHIEVPRLRESLALPVVDLVLDETGSVQNAATRAAALVEMTR